MIQDIVVGNILDKSNQRDIIIGMNVEFTDVLGIGAPFANRIRQTRAVTRGSVISFDFDGKRELHMLMCHRIGENGWEDAEQFVRYGLDYLWKTNVTGTEFSIVNIGTGRVGKRDKADQVAIRTAIATSFLPVRMFILDDKTHVPVQMEAQILPFTKPTRIWDMEHGETAVRFAA